MEPRAIGAALLVAFAAIAPASMRAEPLAIVVSSEWDTTALELANLRDVYLGRRIRLFGRRVHRIDLPPGSPSRAGFSRSVLGRREAELELYWIEQALAGGALPPRQVSSFEEAIAAARRAGVIAYLPMAELAGRKPTGLRVLPILVEGVALRPGDADYPVHTRD